MITLAPMNIGVIYWGTHSGSVSTVRDLFKRMGCEVTMVQYDRPIPDHLDFLLAFGPHGSLVPIMDQLRHRNLVLVLWMTEQFPAPVIPRWLTRQTALLRSGLEHIAFNHRKDGILQLNSRWNWLVKSGLRFRYYGDLLWLRRAGISHLLVVGSRWIKTYLDEDGIESMVGFYGYHQDMGHDLAVKRDIPVLWLGKIGTNRRGDLLRKLRQELQDRGIEMMVIDGVENPYVFGEERTRLLNRTKLTVNLLRREWDNHSMRFYLASANKVLVISEPTYAHIPFSPDDHYISVPFSKMADTICYYLDHNEERQAIASRAHQLLTTDLTMEKAAGQILTAVRRRLNLNGDDGQ